MITVILVESQNSGNIGAVARVMRNFGFENLILVNPRVEHKNREALDRSCHSKHILKSARVEGNLDFLKEFDLTIATTGVMGTDYNLLRTSVSCAEIGSTLKRAKKKNVGIIFGREDQGLKNAELKLCDIVMTIPSNKEYPSLNLSHAVGVVCYEASKVYLADNILGHINKPITKEKEILDESINRVLDKLVFTTNDKKETAQTVLKRVIMKSSPSKRELMALIGFFKKL